eukprot:NODE_3004_length_611_cov_26.001779_g2509_i0.p2 GENE.NODE_3004_length_611_cov_26.001779_g2509_i0~~NODE_3004_length_611_cov_26.001779_g2509_i0.p2  ORF type:complete len:101 (-),score=19.67 NODE_3004_length_611_cov_26.001779_g2509_i0:113-415(-)
MAATQQQTHEPSPNNNYNKTTATANNGGKGKKERMARMFVNGMGVMGGRVTRRACFNQLRAAPKNCLLFCILLLKCSTPKHIVGCATQEGEGPNPIQMIT